MGGIIDDVESLFGGGSAKEASKRQAAGIRESTEATVRQANYQALASADQIAAAQARKAQVDEARRLLDLPQNTVEVDLSPSLINRTERRRSYRSELTGGTYADD